MKTRVFHTKFWTDNYITQLPPTYRLLYLYYLTNDKIEKTGIYEMSDALTALSTGMNRSDIETAKQKFHDDRKIMFYNEYVYIVNFDKYQDYTGASHEVAKDKELELIPDTVIDYFEDTLLTPPQHPVDGSIKNKEQIINNKTQIINNKTKRIRNKFKPPSLEEVKKYISEKGYSVDPKTFFDYFDAGNWVDSKGNKVRSWKQKIITWNNHGGGGKREKKTALQKMLEEE